MAPKTHHSGPATDDRGQTGIDFLVGAATFLLAVGFVFAFLPTMFDPFVATGTSNALIADRTATDLAENRLVEPDKPTILHQENTTDFFTDCENEDISVLLGVDTDRIYIEIEGLDDPNNGGELTCGDEPPDGASVTVSQRIVYAPWNGSSHTLYVRVW